MAKRFVDTKLHKKAWFRKLNLALREAFRILCAECDEIGIWEIDLEALNFSLGLDQDDLNWVTIDKLAGAFDLQVIDDDKLFIPSFVAFQYGDEAGVVSAKNKMAPKILRMLKARGLPLPRLKDEVSLKPLATTPHAPPIPHRSPSDGVKEQEQVQVQEKVKVKVQEGEFEGKRVSAAARQEAHMRFNFPALFDLYPRYQKRTQSLALMAENIRDEAAYRELEAQIGRYRAHAEREGTPFSKTLTFPNFWLERADWSDERTGTSTVENSELKGIAAILEAEARKSGGAA